MTRSRSYLEGTTLTGNVFDVDNGFFRRYICLRENQENPMIKSILICPDCRSPEVTVSQLQRFMANTLDHYCFSIKIQDDESQATCLHCEWSGQRYQLLINSSS